MSDVNTLFMGEAPASQSPTTPNPDAKGPDFVRKWLEEVRKARNDEKKWREEARKTVEIYECDKGNNRAPFNILYSNTETLSPALYNQVPRPRVRPRFKTTKNVAIRAGAQVAERLLEFLLDTGDAEYPSFDSLMKSTVLHALVPGRGHTRFKYDADIAQLQDPESGAGPSTTPTEAAKEEVAYETVCGELVSWDCFFHGYAKQWKDVPWIGYEWSMTSEELEKNFGDAGKRTKVAIPAVADPDSDVDQDKMTGQSIFGSANALTARTPTAPVFEIWDKVRRKVIFISPNNRDEVLKESDDPLGLQGFFTTPEPMGFFAKLSTLCPTPLYQAYEQQAAELNETTRRITAITKALKVRGYYNASLSDLKKVLQAKDNDMVPVSQAIELLSQGGKLTDAIGFLPIETLVAVLQQLMAQREQIKQTIYEVTGVADVMRGVTQASETLGAQELKAEWGTLRLKRMQKEVARYARDCLRIMLEIAVTKLSVDTIAQMTGLPFPTAESKAMAQQQLAQIQASMAMQQASTGQPPQENPAVAQLKEVASLPSWEEILKALQNDTQRNYSIDIETNSTVDLEATEDKKDLGELLNAIAQFLNGVGPMIQEGIMPFEVAKAMLTNILSRFRMGDEVIDMIDKMQPPEPKADPAAQKAQVEMQGLQMEQKFKQEDRQGEMQIKQMETQLKERELQMKERELAMEMQFKEREHQLKMQELQMKGYSEFQKAQLQAQQGQQQLAMGQQKMAMDAAAGEQRLRQDAQAGEQKLQQQQAADKAKTQQNAVLFKQKQAQAKTQTKEK